MYFQRWHRFQYIGWCDNYAVVRFVVALVFLEKFWVQASLISLYFEHEVLIQFTDLDSILNLHIWVTNICFSIVCSDLNCIWSLYHRYMYFDIYLIHFLVFSVIPVSWNALLPNLIPLWTFALNEHIIKPRSLSNIESALYSNIRI